MEWNGFPNNGSYRESDLPVSNTIASSHPSLAAANLGAAASPEAKRSPRWSHTISVQLFLLAIFCIPVQLEVPAVRAVLRSRFAPGDLFLALSVILAPASFRLIRRPLGYLPLALPLTLAYGAVISLTLQGYLTSHALNVKIFGSVVILVMAIVTMAYAYEGFAVRIIRAFLYGIGFWGIIGYIDWRVADIFPWLEVDVESRFGALQFDPNNTGAAFSVALLMSWRYGNRVFTRRWVWIAMTIMFAIGLGLTLSRGAYIGTAAAVLVILIVDHISAERWVRYLVSSVVIVAFLFATGFVNTAVDDFTRRPDTVESRGGFVDISVDRWVDSRGLGMGLGVFRAETGRIVHNTSIWLVTEMSLPGLLLFLAVVIVPASAALRLRRYDHELAMALLASHTAIVVASVGIEAMYQRTWWMVIALTMMPAAAIRRSRHEADTKPPSNDAS
ncbi:MAG: hypothetical protein ACI9C1_001893 [Candidatus Aldehydirespiratoraceae bacterium]|jgi:hypothetical protein